jgi:glycosyltransferase involved in cell wall biosynthesis
MIPNWTIGLPCYNNFTEVYFTVQSLRVHHDMRDKEIVVIDNYGDKILEDFCKSAGGFNNWPDFSAEYPGETQERFNQLVRPGRQGVSRAGGRIRYRLCKEIRGVSYAKNKIFEHARGTFVLCIDSHILIAPGAFDVLPIDDNFIQGPCFNSVCDKAAYEWLPIWRAQMWGIWGAYMPENELPRRPIDIWGMGAGFFACRRDSWLGFNSEFRGFGGETGYIQEKYRRSGRRVLCYPWMKWLHFFGGYGRQVPYPLRLHDRVRNYILGFEEIGLDTDPIKKHFGERLFNSAKSGEYLMQIPGPISGVIYK